MKVFKFTSENYHYAFSGKDENEAKEALLEHTWDDLVIDKVEEIPESEWDEKIIMLREDNDIENEPYYESVREQMCGETPTMIFTNDPDLID